MRPIDADALKKEVKDFPNCYNGWNGWSDNYDKAFIIGAIEEQPTIDAVIVYEDAPSIDIVRCKECKYWIGVCTNEIWQSPTDDYLPQTDADDYCSYGEREGE